MCAVHFTDCVSIYKYEDRTWHNCEYSHFGLFMQASKSHHLFCQRLFKEALSNDVGDLMCTAKLVISLLKV